MQDMILLSKDTPIARVVSSNIEPIIDERLPLFLKRTGNMQAWLESRAIDSHRANSRLLKRVMRLEHKDDLTTVLAVNAATITDNYWVKPIDDDTLQYENVRFKGNQFDDLALTGDVNSFNKPPSSTPELTNTGSFEKCWRFEDGAWWMYKAGKQEELFSELLAYDIGNMLGLNIAYYEAAGDYIKSLDFTDNAAVDFEPAAAIIGDTHDYIKIYEMLREVNEDVAEQYVLMCYFDAVIFNMDRHEYNFGILRNSDTGEVISFAPFFDHNISLISRGYPHSAPNDVIISDFISLVQHTGEPIKVRKLTESKLLAVINKIPFYPPKTNEVPSPDKFTANYIISRQTTLESQCSDLLHLCS